MSEHHCFQSIVDFIIKLRVTRRGCKKSWWRHQTITFPHYWPFVHKDQWRGALMLSLICALIRPESWGWWFETPPRSLWRHCNVLSLSPGKWLNAYSTEINRRYIIYIYFDDIERYSRQQAHMYILPLHSTLMEYVDPFQEISSAATSCQMYYACITMVVTVAK